MVEAGLVDEAGLAKARQLQGKEGGSLGQALVRMGVMDDATFTEFTGKVYNLPVIGLDKAEIEMECIDMIPGDVARKFQLLPINRSGRVLTVAMANPAPLTRQAIFPSRAM